jgi:hypothetical protein
LKNLIGESGKVITGAYTDSEIDALGSRPRVLQRSSLTSRLDADQLKKLLDELQ